MLYNQIFSALALLSLTAAASIPAPKTFRLPLTKRPKTSNSTVSVPSKREAELVLENQQYYYSTTIKIGSNGQEITVDVDTGSSDLWVGSANFDSSESSTFQSLDTAFSISYGDGSGATGTYATDDVTIGDVTVKNAEFAVATQNSAGSYIFGVGLKSGEASVQYTSSGDVQGEYDNLPVSLKKQGFIDAASYSLWLDDWTDSDGSILFGGVDHTKYQGTLGKLPIISVIEGTEDGPIRPNELTRFTVVLNDISLQNSNGDKSPIVSGASVPVLLDSGTTNTLLPEDWLEAIAASFGATYDDNNEIWTTTKPDNDGHLVYNFAGIEIGVPFTTFLHPLTLTSGAAYTNDNGEQLYSLGIQKEYPSGVDLTSGTIYILGDTFLSAAYIVYDLDNKEIALAPAVTGTISSEDIAAIGTSGIPSATQAPSYSSTSTNTEYTLATVTSGFL